MKKALWATLLALSLTILAACGQQGAATSPTAPAAPAATTPPAAGGETGSSGGATADTVDRSRLSSELFLFNWSDYIDPALLEAFEQEFGVRVVLDTYDSNEDMIARVRAGNSGYDIVVPSDYAVSILAAENLVQPLDRSLLPNFRHLNPDLLNQPFDPNNTHSVPYFYGITGIAYNAEFFPNGVNSWAALFDPAQIEAYRGRFSMLDDERETPGAALKFIGSSLNETDPAKLEQAKQILIAQKPFLAAYNSSDVNRRLASGEYVIAHAWSGTAMQARNGLGGDFSGNPNIRFVIPQEGGMIWMDNMAILADSPNAYTAHVFINFLMRPEIAAQNTEWVGFLTPNVDAVPLLSQEIKDLYAEGFAPDAEVRQRLEWAQRMTGSQAFTDLWTAVKSE